MLGELLPDLVLLALVLAFIVSGEARVTAATSQRSRRITAISSSRRRVSRASAMVAPADRVTNIESASRILHALARGTPAVALHQARVYSTALPPTSPEEMHHGQP